MIHKLIIIVVFGIALVTINRTRGEIISGRADITCAFDFSAHKCASSLDSADVALGLDGCWMPYSCFERPFAYVAPIPDTTLGEVCGPPENPAWGCFGGSIEFCPTKDDAFIMYTRDGYWVKFAFTLNCVPMPGCSEILYFIQTDGSSNLCPVPIEPTSWGEIKALYE